MVAELLRLKLRLLVNGFREERAAGRAALTILAAVLLVAGLAVGASLTTALDAVTLRRVAVVASALLGAGAFVVPFVVARRQLFHPRALRPFGWRPAEIGLAVLLTTLVGPAAVLLPLAVIPLLLWTSPDEGLIAALAAPGIVVEGLLAARLGLVVGSVLRYRRGLSRLIRVLTALAALGAVLVLVAHLAPSLAELLPQAWWSPVLGVVLALAPLRDPAIAEFLARLPLGAFWRAPSSAHLGDLDVAWTDLRLGLLAVAVLLTLGILWLRVSLRATRRVPRERTDRVPGWFRRLRSTPVGAIAARSATYWLRDPRYRSVLPIVLVVPVVTLAALLVAGIPLSIAVLVPLPIVVLLLAWSTLHNDLALDSTAFWVHVAAATRGVDDRVGRATPVLVLGGLATVLGVPVVTLVHGDGMMALALVGVCVAVLFGGVGLASAVSARFPYPATRPGDPAHLQPQVAGESGASVQAWSLIGALLVAAPAVAALVVGLLSGVSGWYALALVLGSSAGGGALVLGVRSGAAAVDERAPELLEFTTRH